MSGQKTPIPTLKRITSKIDTGLTKKPSTVMRLQARQLSNASSRQSQLNLVGRKPSTTSTSAAKSRRASTSSSTLRMSQSSKQDITTDGKMHKLGTLPPFLLKRRPATSVDKGLKIAKPSEIEETVAKAEEQKQDNAKLKDVLDWIAEIPVKTKGGEKTAEATEVKQLEEEVNRQPLDQQSACPPCEGAGDTQGDGWEQQKRIIELEAEIAAKPEVIKEQENDVEQVNVIPGIYLAACGLGLTLIPGLSYAHIRAPGRWRAFHMAMCYFWFLSGIGGTATIFLHDRTIWVVDTATGIDETIHTNFAISLLAASGFVVVLVAVNEMLQREGIVDYKKPLDFDTDIAHESGKLMNQTPKRNLYNNFTTTAPATVDNGGMPKQWNSSTEQIVLGGRRTSGKNYHVLWMICMIFTKLQGFVAFYWIFVSFGITYTMLLFEATTVGYTIYWFMVVGSLIGMLALLVLSPKIVFVLASILHTVGLILAVAFYSTDAGWIHMGVSFIVFSTFIGASLVIPAINILELSPLNFNESFLAIGSIFELIAIALMQYFAATDVRLFGLDPNSGFPAANHKDVIAAHFIGMIVLSVILQVIVLWHMPNTYKKSLAEINSDLSRMTSYFAFSRTMVPLDNRAAAARTFTESLATEQLEIEEKQLSTRNNHLATRFGGGDRSDDSTGRRSPYNNDFSETRYYRRTVVEREVSPGPDRDDPYFQEQLQRQHERNYILSRQQHHRARESPDPQQYNYRQSDNRFQQRYLTDQDEYHQDHPRSSGSQPSRHTQAPHLLSRQQYYEQYAQEHPDPVPLAALVHRQSPVRQPSISPAPVETQPVIPPPILHRSQISQTVKSEPGYVSRPRLLQTQKSEAPAPPPLPPADYLTKSLPRIKPDRPGEPRRESIHPVLVPKPSKPEEEVVPGVEYAHNLRPSEFLRQSRQQSAMYRASAVLT